MQLTAYFKKYTLDFKRPSGTSRGILLTKDTYFIIVTRNNKQGIGECSVLAGLSIDDRPDYEQKLQWVCNEIYTGLDTLLLQLEDFPSIQFGLEMAFASLSGEDMFELIPSEFTQNQAPIAINGLIWMGERSFIKTQIREKIDAGFSCIKMKIGALDFKTELSIIKDIRKEYSQDDITLRVDANGAFKASEALEKLKWLSDYYLHSIEQPIAVKQWEQMAVLCEHSPLDIALDEELIGLTKTSQQKQMLESINPSYIILKPSLIGGFKAADAWIENADKLSINWWITSALESNVGLNAICQYTFAKNSNLPQGLGTGSLYTNNINSPLVVANGTIFYDRQKTWDFSKLKNL